MVINLHDKVYIGDSERDKIERVKRRISDDELTETARGELPFMIEQVVAEREQDFVTFFNKAISITPSSTCCTCCPGSGRN